MNGNVLSERQDSASHEQPRRARPFVRGNSRQHVRPDRELRFKTLGELPVSPLGDLFSIEVKRERVVRRGFQHQPRRLLDHKRLAEIAGLGRKAGRSVGGAMPDPVRRRCTLLRTGRPSETDRNQKPDNQAPRVKQRQSHLAPKVRLEPDVNSVGLNGLARFWDSTHRRESSVCAARQSFALLDRKSSAGASPSRELSCLFLGNSTHPKPPAQLNFDCGPGEITIAEKHGRVKDEVRDFTHQVLAA